MPPENRATVVDILVETQDITKRVTATDILVETRSIIESRATVADIMVETQEITDNAKHVTSVLIYIEWHYPQSKCMVQMI